MIIRCPQCEHSRTINESKIPSSAELATCPKCKHRFRFRTLSDSAADSGSEEYAGLRPGLQSAPGPSLRFLAKAAEEESRSAKIQYPQGAVRETAPPDIWDAVDSLHHRWQTQMDQHVTEVVTPKPLRGADALQASGAGEEQPSAAPDKPLPDLGEPYAALDKASAALSLDAAARAGNMAAPGEISAASKKTSTASGKTAAMPAGIQMQHISLQQAAQRPVPQDPHHAPHPDSAVQAPPRQSTARRLVTPAISPEDDALSPGPVPPRHPQHQTGADAAERFSEPYPWSGDASHPQRPSGARETSTPDPRQLELSLPEHRLPDPRPADPAQSDKPAVFPYASDGPPPEQRVERDIRLLRDSQSRPLRDLGKLEEQMGAPQTPVPSGRTLISPDEGPHKNATLFAGGPNDDSSALSEASRLASHTGAGEEREETEEDNAAETAAESAVPWENPARYGWIRGFMKTIHGVMFAGPAFFSRVTTAGSLASGYLFFLLMGYVSILGSVIWVQATTLLLPETAQMVSHRFALPVLLLLAPVALGLMQLFVTGSIRIVLQLFAPDRSDFPLVYKVVSYSVAPLILSVVPFVGPAVGAVWFLAALITGCRNTLKISWRLAVFAPLPPALLLLSGLVWYFL